jgi:hypothetical protein
VSVPRPSPDVIWICRECWRQRSGAEVVPPHIPAFIGACAECDATDVALVYVRVGATSKQAYKGRLIRLTPSQQDGRWGCHFLVIKPGNTQGLSQKGYVDQIFSSSPEAEAAALRAA